jgi:S1-C subfamily serine protease
MRAKRCMMFRGWFLAAVVSVTGGAAAAPPSVPPPSTAARAATSPATSTPKPAERSWQERLRRGVVTVRLGARTVAAGMVLDADGRILTALQPLGRGVGLSVRYADGTTLKAQVVHTDRAWDLALLTPDEARWTEGLQSSRIDPYSIGQVLYAPRLAGVDLSANVTLPSPQRETLTGGDAIALTDAMTFGPGSPSGILPGSPVVDPNGDVVGLFAEACSPHVTAECSPITYAAPTLAIRRFLRDTPPGTALPRPWLGIRVSPATQGGIVGVRIDRVEPDSPLAGLRLRTGAGGDLLLAANGSQITMPDELENLLGSQRVGSPLTLLFLSDGRYREARVVLGDPRSVSSRQIERAAAQKKDVGY